MFCTACPAAPFTRLSMAITTTARLVFASQVTPMSKNCGCATPRRSHVRRVEKPHKRFRGVLAFVDSKQVFGARNSRGAEVDGLENPPVER